MGIDIKKYSGKLVNFSKLMLGRNMKKKKKIDFTSLQGEENLQLQLAQ